MRLHAGQLEDVPAGIQRGCDVPKTLFAHCGESQNKTNKQKKKKKKQTLIRRCILCHLLN